MNVFQLIQQGGPIMYVLLCFSILAVALILLKVYHFYLAEIWKKDLVSVALSELKLGNLKSALKNLEGSKKPCSQITKRSIELCLDKSYSATDIQSEIKRFGSNKLRELETYIRGLSVIAHIAPLVGLLGTVTGMIAAFISLEKAGGQASPAMLAGGIWEALLTTAFGLTIAIPALVAYYFLEGEVDKVKARMKDAVSQVLLVFNQINEDKDSDFKTSNIAKENYEF